jgi:hypothetical protein
MPDHTTTTALAAQAQCRPNTVTKWARLHGIKPIGRDYLFSEQQVAAFLSRDRTPGRKPKPDAEITRSAKLRRKSRREKANDDQ